MESNPQPLLRPLKLSILSPIATSLNSLHVRVAKKCSAKAAAPRMIVHTRSTFGPDGDTAKSDHSTLSARKNVGVYGKTEERNRSAAKSKRGGVERSWRAIVVPSHGEGVDTRGPGKSTLGTKADRRRSCDSSAQTTARGNTKYPYL